MPALLLLLCCTLSAAETPTVRLDFDAATQDWTRGRFEEPVELVSPGHGGAGRSVCAAHAVSG